MHIAHCAPRWTCLNTVLAYLLPKVLNSHFPGIFGTPLSVRSFMITGVITAEKRKSRKLPSWSDVDDNMIDFVGYDLADQASELTRYN